MCSLSLDDIKWHSKDSDHVHNSVFHITEDYIDSLGILTNTQLNVQDVHHSICQAMSPNIMRHVCSYNGARTSIKQFPLDSKGARKFKKWLRLEHLT